MGPVDHEASGPLTYASLQELPAFNCAPGRVQHRKKGSDCDVGVDVRGAVERIDRHEQRTVAIDLNGIITLLGNHAAHARTFKALDK